MSIFTHFFLISAHICAKIVVILQREIMSGLVPYRKNENLTQKQNMKNVVIAAACLVASISWAAEVTFTMSDIFDGQKLSFDVTSPVSAKVSSNTSKGNAPQGKLGSTNNYFEIILNNDTYSSAKINGYINTNNTSGYDWGFQFSTDKGATWSQTVSQPNDGNKTVHEITVNATIPANANGFRRQK